MKEKRTFDSPANSGTLKKAATISTIAIFIICIFAAAYCGLNSAQFGMPSVDNVQTASAATIADSSSFNTTIRQSDVLSTGTTYELTTDITLSSGYSEKTFKSTLDGEYTEDGVKKRHKITIADDYSPDIGNPTNQTDHYVGLIFGTFSGTIKNVIIEFTGNYTLKATNSRDTGGAHIGRQSTTLYGGIICGLSAGGKFENVDLIVNGTFIVQGIDGSSSSGSGNGGVAGGFAGRSKGATIDSCKLNLAGGIIHAIGENNEGGARKDTSAWYQSAHYEYNKSNQKANNPCRAVSGGFVGELYADKNASTRTSFLDVEVAGNGAVGAYVSGNFVSYDGKKSYDDGAQYALTSNMAGLMIGYSYHADDAGTTDFLIEGMLYKFTGTVYVACNTRTIESDNPDPNNTANLQDPSDSKSKRYAGLIVGNGGAYTLNSFWRDTGDAGTRNSKIKYYSGALNLSDIDTSSGAPETLGSSIKDRFGNGYSANSCTNVNEWQLNATHGNTTSSSYGTYTIDSIGNKKLNITVTAKSNFYVSSVEYWENNKKSVDKPKTFDTQNYSFTNVSSKATSIVAHLALMQSSMFTSFDKPGYVSTKDYDAAGFSFQGAPTENGALVDTMGWGVLYKNTLVQDSVLTLVQNPVLGTNSVDTGSNVGEYEVRLYKVVNNEFVEAVTGDVFGPDDPNVPSIIYTYTKSAQPYTYRINPINIEIEQLTGAAAIISKTYDANYSVTINSFAFGKQYKFVRRVSENVTEDLNSNLPRPILSITESYFANSSTPTVPSADANDSKVVHVSCELSSDPININYILSDSTKEFTFTGCRIDPFVIELQWANTEFTYDGLKHNPTATAKDIEQFDSQDISVNVTYNVYENRAAYNSGQDTIDAIDVKLTNNPNEDYYVHATMSTNTSENNNFRIDETNLDHLGHTFKILPKTIGVNWTDLTKTYNTSAQFVTCSFKDGDVLSRDAANVSLNVKYYATGSSVETDFLNAGTYYAVAALSGNKMNNYLLDDTATGKGLTMRQMYIALSYKTGNNSNVQNLTYCGENFINNAKGLQASIATTGTGLNTDNITLKYYLPNDTPTESIVTIGSYVAKASLNNRNGKIPENFILVEEYAQCTINVVPKPVTLTFGDPTAADGYIRFIFNNSAQRPQKISVPESEICYNNGRKDEYTLAFTYFKLNPTESLGTTPPKNVGEYQIAVDITESNPCYVIDSGYATKKFYIDPYDITASVQSLISVNAIADLPYTGDFQTPSTTVKYNTSNLTREEDYTINYFNHKNVGQATAVITGIGNFTGTRQVTFNITTKTVAFAWSEDERTRVYNGSNFTVNPTITGLVDGETNVPAIRVKYYNNSTVNDSGSYSAPKNVGEYTAIAEFSDPASVINYRLPNENDSNGKRKFVFSITQKSISLKISKENESDTFIFDGTQHAMKATWSTADALCAGDALTITVEYLTLIGEPVKDKNNNPIAPIEAGGYYVKVTVSCTDATTLANYAVAKEIRQEINIEKRDVRITVAAVNATYDGTAKSVSPQPVSADSEISGYPIKYNIKYTRNSSTTSTPPSNAGQYIATVTADGTNYNLVDNSDGVSVPSASVTIAPFTLRAYLDLPTISIYQGGDGATASYHFDQEQLFGRDKLTLDITYTQIYADGSEKTVDNCRDAGQYRIELVLPTSGNYTFDRDNSILVGTLSIAKRKVAYKINYSGNINYKGDNYIVEADTAQGDGVINFDTDNTGIAPGDSKSALSFAVTIYKVLKNSDDDVIGTEQVNAVRDVGDYTVTVALKNSANYELADEPTGSMDICVKPKAIKFSAKEIRKEYGTADKEDDFVQTLSTDVTGTNEEITVILKRAKGANNEHEVVGAYDYIGIANADEHPNYTISLDMSTSYQFHIDKRNVTPPAPEPFHKSYGSADPELRQAVSIYTEVFNEIVIYIIYTRNTAGEDATKDKPHNLSPNVEIESDGVHNKSNFNVYIKPENLIGKFIIDGLKVTVELDESKLVTTYNPASSNQSEPDFVSFIKSVDVDSCADNVKEAYYSYCAANGGSGENFDWSGYVRITRKLPNDPKKAFFYQDGGYDLDISFLKSDRVTVDGNYDAVSTSGGTYKYVINKLDLRDQLTSPVVRTNKPYDGKTSAEIIATNIDTKYSSEGLTVYATYNDANAGTDKIITITYNFGKNGFYSDNYILPEPFNYEANGTISKLILQASMTLAVNKITYGMTPDVSIDVRGFITGENMNTEGINLKAVYAYDESDISEIKDVAQYQIRLKLIAGVDNINYDINYSETTATLEIGPKTIEVKERAPYSKPVDGSTATPNFGPTNYIIEGLLPIDEGRIDIDYNTLLSSVEPGAAIVTVSINSLYDVTTNERASNYTWTKNTFTVQATILTLADVIMRNAAYDFDTFDHTIVPELTNKLEGVTYKLEYIGRGGTDYPTTDVAPINAGDYVVKCYLVKDGYVRYAAEAELRIRKILPSITFDGPTTQVYGSFTPITAVVEAAGLHEPLNVEYSFMDNGIMPKFAPAGKEHIVSARYPGSQNYYPVSADKSLTINQKVVSVKFSGYTDLVYNGLDRALTDEIKVEFDGLIEGDVCEPIKAFSPGVVKNAGTYFLEVRLSNNNYKTTGRISITFTIAKKTLTVSATADPVKAGTKPSFNIKYDGFVDNEDESKLNQSPKVNLSGNQVGTNPVVFIDGYDTNYDFVYAESVYTITYEPKEDPAKKSISVPIIIIISIGAVIALIVVLAMAVKSSTFSSMYNVAGIKRDIRNKMYGKKRK